MKLRMNLHQCDSQLKLIKSAVANNDLETVRKLISDGETSYTTKVHVYAHVHVCAYMNYNCASY